MNDHRHGQPVRPNAPHAHGTGVSVRHAPAHSPTRRERSPHVLDLGAKPRETEKTEGAGMPWFFEKGDHLRDLRARRIAVRPEGWDDFPPRSATSLTHALTTAVRDSFSKRRPHRLTAVTLAHLLLLVSWHVLTSPVRAIARGMRFLTAPKKVAQKVPQAPRPRHRSSTKPSPDAQLKPVVAVRAPIGWRRTIVGFTALSAVIAMPFGTIAALHALDATRSDVLSMSIGGVEDLKRAADAARNRDFAGANRSFADASTRFTNAKSRLGFGGAALMAASRVLPGTTAASAAGRLLSAANEIASGGAILTATLASARSGTSVTEKIAAISASAESALAHFERAEKAVSGASPEAVPPAYREQLTDAKRDIPTFVESMRRASSLAALIPEISGFRGPRRYLFVFQNNAELRPGGGFIGSFALVDVRDGKIENIEVPGGGSYDLKGGLKVAVASPQPLHLVNPRWQFQDANWSPDFPTSAKTIKWFYEKSGGPTTDGVIAITTTLMERLLRITGPIDMPEYGATIDAQNFYFETQKEVEIDYDKAENKPKKFIGDLAPKVIEKLMAIDDAGLLDAADALNRALEEKHLLVWFADPALESKIAERGWDGAIRGVDGDYLSVVHANIGGQKTDFVMQEDIDHAVKVLPDGSAIATLTVTRAHTGSRGALFSGVRNVDYVRVYVPEGSTLVEASGFSRPDPKLFKLTDPSHDTDPSIGTESDGLAIDASSGTHVTSENGKTVFGNWLQTDPGETSVATIIYRLPPGTVAASTDAGAAAAIKKMLTGRTDERLTYSLLVQKQPGALHQTFTSRVDLPRGYDVAWESASRAMDDRGRRFSTFPLEKDAFLSVILRSR